MKLQEPTNTAFVQSEQALTDILSDYSSQLDTKKGSVIRELLIRPYSYLYAQVNNIVSNWLTRTSVAYLSQTQDTSDSIADLVASNYFVTRRQGQFAKGIVTLTCDAPQVRIGLGTTFLIDSNLFSVQKTYIATAAEGQDTDTVGYLKMYSFQQGVYQVNVPVIASQEGQLEIPAGSQVIMDSYISGVTEASLTSPVTGGSDTETNASMMQRCKTRCGSSIGTQDAIRTKMQEAPVSVISCAAVGSGQPGSFISRYNNLALPAGGYIDVYAKTSNQSIVGQISVEELRSDSQGLYAQISSQDYPAYAGFSRILKVEAQDSDSLPIGTYTIAYSSIKDSIPDSGARGSCYQKAIIRFNELSSSRPVLITLQYQSGIAELQKFMDSTYGAFLGQVCTVRGAVPATARLNCQVYSPSGVIDEAVLLNMKQTLADIINTKQVGDYSLNMDQVAQIFQSQYTDYKLRLPYTLSIELPMTNGGSYTFNSVDGTANILYRHQLYHWNASAYFFSTTPSYIELKVL